MAGPVFRDVATTALRMLDVPKDLPDDVLVTSAKKPSAEADDLAIAGLGAPPEDELRDQVVSSVTQPPVSSEASSDASDSRTGGHFLDGASAAASGPKVPDFRGMTLRAVLEESSARGLGVEALGQADAGLVRNQDPPAGAVLTPGARVRVQFAR